ncbi:MAG: hypothetical protein U5L96_07640 [Owenweeksia sp.]|nr:hypothetical protein [Owenweeksia sp.]
MWTSVCRDENLNNGDTVNVYGASVYRTSNLTSIDYGNGAIGPDGKTRKGLIKVVETGDYDTPGGRLTVSFDAYKVEDKPVTGDIDVMNNGNDSLSLSVLNFSINEKFNLNSNKTLLWKSGFDTEDASDDLFEFWGQSIGSDNVSDNLTADILNKIVLDRSCQYGVTEGVIDMVFDNDTSST